MSTLQDTIFFEKFDTPFQAIPFDKIKNDQYLPSIHEAIKIAKQQINEIVKNSDSPTFENTIEALEYCGDLVDLISGVAFNLNSSETSDELQEVTKQMAPLLSEYHNDILLNEQLFKKVKRLFWLLKHC